MRTTRQFSITLPHDMAEAAEDKIKSGPWSLSMWRSASDVKMTCTKSHLFLPAARRALMRLRIASTGTPFEASARYS